jgi:hypothetical protein
VNTETLLKIITRLFGKKAGEYAKAVIVQLGGLVAVVIQWAATGTLDRAELITAGSALLASAIVALTPNAKPARKR